MHLPKREVQQHIDDNAGYCTVCDAITTDGGVEPDADGYECEQCENDTVKGVEQAVADGDIVVIGGNFAGEEDE